METEEGAVSDKGSAKTTQGAAVLALQPSPLPAREKTAPAPPPARAPRWEDALAVVTVRGDLDRDALEAIDYAVGRATAEAGRIVLDLLDVTHLDYASVHVLVDRRRELLARGGDLLLAVRNPYVANILRASGGADLVLCRTVEEASGAVVTMSSSRARRR
jgi:anti-anti-sigma factor